MALSAFDDKSHAPTNEELRRVLGDAYEVWTRLIVAVAQQIDPLSEVWGFTGKTTGWGLRLRCKDRVILYMTPQSGQFLVSLALGEKAVAAAHKVKLPAYILEVIDAAPRYAEGRGVRLEVSQKSQVRALAILAEVKHQN